jgi:hypothetical protein
METMVPVEIFAWHEWGTKGNFSIMFSLCWNFYFFVQEFGGNISSIWPAECVELWMNCELLEDISVLKWSKHLAVKFLTHVYIAFGSVRKKDVNRIVTFVFCSYYLRDHFLLQRCYFLGWKTCLDPFPGIEKFFMMQIKPLQYVPQSPPGKISMDNACLYVNGNLVFPYTA